MVQAPAPARLIAGGLPTERLVAHVLVAKYADHCPLYRQSQILARQGIAIDRSILAFWVGYAAAEIKPLWRLMREELLRSTKLFVDETTAPVLDPGRGRTKTGYFWVLARDDRPWRGRAPPAVVYSYAPGRGGEHAMALLRGYAGVLQTDAYAAYGNLADPKRAGGPVTLAYCWAHWRRQLFDLAKSPPAPIATEALQRIAEFYQIEAEIRGSSADERQAVRQQKTKPLVEALKTWLEKTLAAARRADRRSPKPSATAQSMGRAHRASSTTAASRSTPIPSSAPCARLPLTEKMHSSPAADEGAENWAMLASLIETCKLHGINPRGLLHRRADQARQQLAQPPPRRIAALGLDRRYALTPRYSRNAYDEADRHYYFSCMRVVRRRSDLPDTRTR